MLNCRIFGDFDFFESLANYRERLRNDCLSADEEHALAQFRKSFSQKKIYLNDTDKDQEYTAAILDKCKVPTVPNRNHADALETEISGSIHLCQRKSPKLNQKGILCLTANDIISRNIFCDVHEKKVEQGAIVDMQSIFRHCLPDRTLSSVIIIDNYAAESSPDNLNEILKAVLPYSYSGSFHLGIVCYANTETNNWSKYLNETWLQRQMLDAYPYEIKLVVIKLDGDFKNPEHYIFHDRILITNYSRVYAPGGMDLLKRGKASKTTIYQGLYPDFVGFGEDIIKSNLHKFFFNNDLVDAIHSQHKEVIYENPILKQYMNTKEYLCEKVNEYIALLKKDERISSKCFVEMSDPIYDEVEHSLSLSDLYFCEKEGEECDFRYSRMVFSLSKIIASSGRDGCHNEFINGIELLPDYEYVVDEAYHYYTDSIGRVHRVYAEIGKSTIERNKNNQELGADQSKRIRRDKNGGCAIDTDNCGHLIGKKELGGSNEAINLVPMDYAVNLGIYRGAELSVFKWIEKGYIVVVDIQLTFGDNVSYRPASFKYTAKCVDNSDLSFSVHIPNRPLLGNIQIKY